MTNSSPPTSAAGRYFAMSQSRGRPESRQSMHSRHGSQGRFPDEEQKTAVKVAVRVRPPLDPSDPALDLIPHRFRGTTCKVENSTTLIVKSAREKKLFVFDKVFHDSEDQQGIWEYVSEGVNAFLKGYNVSVLAYGQSGAGKSYTMGTMSPGEQKDLSDKGIIPRAAAALFDKLSPVSAKRMSNGLGLRPPSRYTQQSPTQASFSKAEEKNWQLKATYLEIYNEQLRDLLLPDSIPQNERNAVAIREDTKGRIILTGLHQVNINSVEDLLQALNFGSSIRQTDATMINSKSSRSHAVFSLNLVQKKSRNGSINNGQSGFPSPDNTSDVVTIDSKLHFVDLAGSERLKNSGLSGERVKEGISINAGLAALGKVISQLSSKSQGAHISYRDSKLTRLLQDSLGGNAITYMVACINPVEFHLSETLNTVQYAQRARAIQSKPRIQQRSDEADKQLIIDRLRSEVAFLRDQIRSSQRDERRTSSDRDRNGRKHERENELQNQLLDVQENYSALSQRHAKLIADLAKDKSENGEQLPVLKGVLENASLDRLNRSSTFAEAVEHVVMEYEKTIQSLESALSSSRSSLATSESSLLEREAKIVYMDAVTQQLQSRIQKALDREATSENYVRELESKLDGINNGEGRHLTIIQDLRRELARIRESEASAEDYISTLEERLAEAEQDNDLMQREINRLETVVERQRGIGKLDNLFLELESIKHEGPASKDGAASRGFEDMHTDAFHDRLIATASGIHQPNDEPLPETAEAEWRSFGPMEGAEDEDAASHYTIPSQYTNSEETNNVKASTTRMPLRTRDTLANSDESMDTAQGKALADKLETITMELFDLKVEHEVTAAELDDIARKYQIALSTLAELQDAMDGARHHEHDLIYNRPGSEGLLRNGCPPSRISSHDDTPTLVDASETATLASERADNKHTSHIMQKEETLAEAIRALKRANAEKDINISELTENYSQLQDQHQDSLNYIEELKDEMQRAQTQTAALTVKSPDRRKSAMGREREARVFAALRNLGSQHLERGSKDSKAFDVHLDAIATDSQLRAERVQTLEAEVVAARKELGAKNSMISGLAKERSSKSSSRPLDVALVANMRQHVLESQSQIQAFHDQETARTSETSRMIDAIKDLFSSNVASKAQSPSRTTGPGPDTPVSGKDESFADSTVKATEREQEVSQWLASYQAHAQTTLSMEYSLIQTLRQLEGALLNAENLHAEQLAARDLRSDIDGRITAEKESEKLKHGDQIVAMQREIDGYKAMADAHAAKLLHLENSYAQIIQEVEEDSRTRELAQNELQAHRDLVNNLETQIEQQKSLANFHQQGLSSLQENHAKDMMMMSNEHAATLTEVQEKHDTDLSSSREELTKAHMELARLMQIVAGVVSTSEDERLDTPTLQSRLQSISAERDSLIDKHLAASAALETAGSEAEDAKRQVVDLTSRIKELTSLNEETLRQFERSVEKEQKSSRIVQDLEEQIRQNFDYQQNATSKLSASVKARQETEEQLEEFRSKVSSLESQLTELKRTTISSHQSRRESTDLERRPSNASNLRHSTSVASLPSPPPAVPLPPLPPNSASVIESNASPPGSRHTSKDVPSIIGQAAQAQNQHVEDLENRIRTIEKHLFAEKQLTQTLEEALVDLETQANKTKTEVEAWKKKCKEVEEEASGLRRERGNMRNSIQAVEEERDRRIRAEQAQRQLQERMEALNAGRGGKKKKGALNCF